MIVQKLWRSGESCGKHRPDHAGEGARATQAWHHLRVAVGHDGVA